MDQLEYRSLLQILMLPTSIRNIDFQPKYVKLTFSLIEQLPHMTL